MGDANDGRRRPFGGTGEWLGGEAVEDGSDVLEPESFVDDALECHTMVQKGGTLCSFVVGSIGMILDGYGQCILSFLLPFDSYFIYLINMRFR